MGYQLAKEAQKNKALYLMSKYPSHGMTAKGLLFGEAVRVFLVFGRIELYITVKGLLNTQIKKYTRENGKTVNLMVREY
jgi:hypothetical protein